MVLVQRRWQVVMTHGQRRRLVYRCRRWRLTLVEGAWRQQILSLSCCRQSPPGWTMTQAPTPPDHTAPQTAALVEDKHMDLMGINLSPA